MAGGSLADVQRNLDHSTPVLTSEIYGHIAEHHRVCEVDSRLASSLTRSGGLAAEEASKLFPLRLSKT